MKFTRETVAGDVRLIRRCEPGRIVTTHEELTASAIVMGRLVVSDWNVPDVGALDAAAVGRLLALGPELVVLGTGARLVHPDPRLLALFTTQGIGCEVMDTAAACRTYNVLVTEGRAVAAGLVIT